MKAKMKLEKAGRASAEKRTNTNAHAVCAGMREKEEKDRQLDFLTHQQHRPSLTESCIFPPLHSLLHSILLQKDLQQYLESVAASVGKEN